LGSTRIYSLLIMSGHVMGWALGWAASGPGPSPGPLARSLWALGALLVMSRICHVLVSFSKVSSLGRLLLSV